MPQIRVEDEFNYSGFPIYTLSQLNNASASSEVEQANFSDIPYSPSQSPTLSNILGYNLRPEDFPSSSSYPDFDESLIELDDDTMLFHTVRGVDLRTLKEMIARETPADRERRLEVLKTVKKEQAAMLKAAKKKPPKKTIRKPQLYLIDNLPPSVIFGNAMIDIDGKFINEDDIPSCSYMKTETKKGKVPVSRVGKIYLIQGLAGTGKSRTALSYLKNPLVFTKTNALKNKYLKSGLEATTSASFLRIVPRKTQFYELKPIYRYSERDTGIVIEEQTVGTDTKDYSFLYHFTNDKKYLTFHRQIPVSMMTDTLRPYYNKVAVFKQQKDVSLLAKITQDLLFDDFGLEGEEAVQCWKKLFESGAIWSKNIAFTYDENQLNYAGLDLIKYLKENYADRIEEITCKKPWRFEYSGFKWWWFDRYNDVPLIHNYEQAPEGSVFVAHSSRYYNKVRNVGGWPKEKILRIDEVQGREYDCIVVGLAGLAALHQNKTPGYKERIYTTITRGKNIIFYVPESVCKKNGYIRAMIRDVTSALSEIKRPLFYDQSILNLKTPKNIKSCMSSHGKYRRSCAALKLSCRSRFAICGGTATAVLSCEGNNGKNKMRSVLYRPSRFWPEKPRIAALARLFQ